MLLMHPPTPPKEKKKNQVKDSAEVLQRQKSYLRNTGNAGIFVSGCHFSKCVLFVWVCNFNLLFKDTIIFWTLLKD